MIRKAIKEVMKAHKVKQIDLANHVGISKGSISNFLNGKINLNQENIEKIFEFLKIELIYDSSKKD